MIDEQVMQCAAAVLDNFHMMMRTVGPEARRRSQSNLSMQQFRAMKTLEHNQGASLSLVSERLGATLSATSKLIDGLVERGYVCRDTDEVDRRKLLLALTEAGKQILESVHIEVLTCLAEKLDTLTVNERTMLDLAMNLLRQALALAQPTE